MRASVKDLKNNLSAYLKRVRLGEELIITVHHHAVAKLVPLTGEAIATKMDWSSFRADIRELHQKLSKIHLKESMRDTVIKQRNQERS
jgi:prevent-host-death family protein